MAAMTTPNQPATSFEHALLARAAQLDLTAGIATGVIAAEFRALADTIHRLVNWADHPCIETDWPSRTREGYGRRGVRDPRKRTLLAHRVALEEKLGRPLRPRYEACHHCDNPPCIQPEHLYEGTHAQNMRDMANRGRVAGFPPGAQERGPAASAAVRSVATDQVREEIRQRYSEGGISQEALADEYGMSHGTVGAIVHAHAEDRYVVQCNYAERVRAVNVGARAYLVRPNPGGGDDRIVILVRSNGGRWIEKWENIRRLENFRRKTLPPSHPLYGDERIWNYDVEAMASRLNAARDRMTESQR